MTAETRLYEILTAHSPLTALVSTRIYPDAMPANTTYPAIVFSRSSTEPIVMLSGSADGELATLTIEAWSPTRSASADVADAVQAALQVELESIDTAVSLYDPELDLHGISMTCTLLIE